MPQASRDLVLNKDMLRINQDPLGRQGRRIIVQGGPWPKPSLQVLGPQPRANVICNGVCVCVGRVSLVATTPGRRSNGQTHRVKQTN